METHWVCGWGRGTRVVHRTPSVSNDQLKRRPNERNQRGKFVYPVEIVGFGASDCDFGLFRDYCVVCTMDIEEVRPDFEIGITDRGESQESQHSTVSSSADHSGESPEVAKHTTEQQIEKLLNIEKAQSNSPTPPRRQRRKRRRLSRSRSTSPSRHT